MAREMMRGMEEGHRDNVRSKKRCQARSTDNTKQQLLEVDNTFHGFLLKYFSFTLVKDILKMVNVLQRSLHC